MGILNFLQVDKFYKIRQYRICYLHYDKKSAHHQPSSDGINSNLNVTIDI